MSDHFPDEQAFEAYLQGASELSRLYQDSQEPMPPETLDASMLGAAHAAVTVPPRRGVWRRLVPLAAAAIVVLGIRLMIIRDDVGRESLQESPSFDQRQRKLSDHVEKRHKTVVPTELDALSSPDFSARGQVTPSATPPAPSRFFQEYKAFGDDKDAPKYKAFGDDKDAPTNQPGTARPAPAKPSSSLLREGRESAAVPSTEPVLSPEAWLTQIAELRRQGKFAAAAESLAAFTKHYPQYHVAEPLAEPR